MRYKRRSGKPSRVESMSTPTSTASNEGQLASASETVYPPVLSKRDFVRRYSAGEFGNASPTWQGYDDWVLRDSRFHSGLFHIRNRVAGAQTWYDVPTERMAVSWEQATRLFDPSQLYISAMAPTAQTLFQGEVQQSERYLDLRYTTVRKPMRDALREREHSVSGILAIQLLRHYLCGNSFEWLLLLLQRYPHHVIEFSTFAVKWGTVAGFNTVFWEVRMY